MKLNISKLSKDSDTSGVNSTQHLCTLEVIANLLEIRLLILPLSFKVTHKLDVKSQVCQSTKLLLKYANTNNLQRSEQQKQLFFH